MFLLIVGKNIFYVRLKIGKPIAFVSLRVDESAYNLIFWNRRFMDHIKWAKKIKDGTFGFSRYKDIPEEELAYILKKNEAFLDDFFSSERTDLCVEKENYIKKAKEEIEAGMVESNIRDIIESIIKNTFYLDEGCVWGEYIGLARSILEEHKLRMLFEAYEEALEEKGLVIDIKVKKKDY